VTPRAALALAAGLAILAGACRKREEAAPEARPAAVGEPELRRGRDACAAYVEQACACAKTVPAAAEPCKLARALPDSLQTLVEVSAHPDTARQDAVQSADAIRKIIARCIEHTAKLPALGCPAPALRP
jgi:hypothetical protein